MKRIMLLLFSLILLIVLVVACSPGNKPMEGNKDKVNVVTTIFPQYDFIRQIADDNVELAMLLPPGVESHSFELTPQDIIRIKKCDMFVYVGGDSDSWIDDILDSMDTSNMEIISLMDLVDIVEEEIVEGMDDDQGHYHGDEYDEHVWTSLPNTMKIVKALSEQLSAIDPANAAEYKQNTTAYLEKLETLDKTFRETVASGSRKTVVFGDRFPFRYFADTYGLDYFAAFPGCAAQTEPSAATVAFLIDKVKAEKIPAVFHIELSNEKMADTICEATGATKLLLHSCHNVTKDELKNGVTYLDLMTRNVESLKEALK